MAYNIKTNTSYVVNTFSDWVTKYKEQQLQHSHDQSMMTLMTPDESLLVIGPPRLIAGEDPVDADFTVVGLVNTIQYTETAQITPMKAIGSRRHIFAKTNAPVTGSIGRLMVLGSNLYRALYSLTSAEDYLSLSTTMVNKDEGDTAWYTNIEEDLFRIPFGMGIVYASPATMDEGLIYAAEYFEVCVLQSRQASLQTGQAMIMENVSFMADRIVPMHSTYLSKDVNPWGGSGTPTTTT